MKLARAPSFIVSSRRLLIQGRKKEIEDIARKVRSRICRIILVNASTFEFCAKKNR
jgi:hypothetical protein